MGPSIRGLTRIRDPLFAPTALAGLSAKVHAQLVRHATDADLDRAEALLAELRHFPELRERKRGSFSRGSKAFLHFHEDAGDLYVDVRLDKTFQRMRVSSRAEQAEFVAAVRTALRCVNTRPA
jgi:hypothetical protein